MHPGETVRRRIQRVSPLARACGDASPDLEAKVAKQTEKPVPGLPGVVEITYRKGKRNGRRVWFLRFRDPLTRKRTSIRLGEVGVLSYIDMAALAKRYRDDIATGRSPKSAAMTLESFVTLYLAILYLAYPETIFRELTVDFVMGINADRRIIFLHKI